MTDDVNNLDQSRLGALGMREVEDRIVSWMRKEAGTGHFECTVPEFISELGVPRGQIHFALGRLMEIGSVETRPRRRGARYLPLYFLAELRKISQEQW